MLPKKSEKKSRLHHYNLLESNFTITHYLQVTLHFDIKHHHQVNLGIAVLNVGYRTMLLEMRLFYSDRSIAICSRQAWTWIVSLPASALQPVASFSRHSSLLLHLVMLSWYWHRDEVWWLYNKRCSNFQKNSDTHNHFIERLRYTAQKLPGYFKRASQFALRMGAEENSGLKGCHAPKGEGHSICVGAEVSSAEHQNEGPKNLFLFLLK